MPNLKKLKIISFPELESILSSIWLPIKTRKWEGKRRRPFEVRDALPTVLSCAQLKACVRNRPKSSNLSCKNHQGYVSSTVCELGSFPKECEFEFWAIKKQAQVTFWELCKLLWVRHWHAFSECSRQIRGDVVNSHCNIKRLKKNKIMHQKGKKIPTKINNASINMFKAPRLRL